jgi:hypothetical protein
MHFRISFWFFFCSWVLIIIAGFRNNFQDHRRLSEQFSGSQAAFGTIFRVKDGNLKAGTNFLKRTIGRIFKRNR